MTTAYHRLTLKGQVSPEWITGSHFTKPLKGRISFDPVMGFPDGPEAKTPCSQCKGPGFNTWSRN